MPKLKKKVLKKELFECEKCGITLSSSYNLKIHIDTNCSTDKRFICEVNFEVGETAPNCHEIIAGLQLKVPHSTLAQDSSELASLWREKVCLQLVRKQVFIQRPA